VGKYRGYEKYKDSGVEWLGEIPEHWKNLKIKRLTQIKRGASPRPIDDPKYFDDEGEYAWVRIADVTASDRYLEETTQKLSDLGKSFSVPLEYGELFLSIAGSVGKPIITKIKCCIHDGFVYFPTLNANKEFLFYIFNSGQPYLGLGKMGTQLNLNTETVGGINIGLPPLDEQELIAHFLDRKTSQIDTLIAKKEALLEKLDKKRTALISHAVTKGLDRTAPMKDSGVEWLGDIPEHWEMKRLKFISPEQSVGLVINPSTYVDDNGSVPFIYGANIREYKIDFSNARKITEESHNILSKSKLTAGDLLVVRVGEPGVAAVIPNNIDTCNCASVMFIRQHKTFVSEWLCHIFNSRIGRFQVELVAYGAAQQQFNIAHAVDFNFPTPPRSEQQEIVNYLSEQITSIQSVQAATNNAIALLKEYRTALITNAVTGKIDVRQVSII
jgi:type I restriction enzyme, S subunit